MFINHNIPTQVAKIFKKIQVLKGWKLQFVVIFSNKANKETTKQQNWVPCMNSFVVSL